MGIPHRRPRRAGVLTGDVQLSRRDVKSGAADASARATPRMIIGRWIETYSTCAATGAGAETELSARHGTGATTPSHACDASASTCVGRSFPICTKLSQQPPLHFGQELGTACCGGS